MGDRIAVLRSRVLRRLGDEAAVVWSRDTVDAALTAAYLQIAQTRRVFPDWTYLENLPRGFSYTQAWEKKFGSVAFDYGIGNFTASWERPSTEPELTAQGPTAHTCPAEVRHDRLTDLSATADLPATATEIARVVWDRATITALEPATLARLDSRYELTEGEVYGFTYRQDGVRTLRKIRKPAARADTYTVSGSWGICRSLSDLGVAVTGSWGIPRRIDGEHPMGPESFGTPRRFYRDGKNVRVEHWRHGRALSAGCELPARYAQALVEYALARCLEQVGPGQNLTLARYHEQRWQRHLARIDRRVRAAQAARVSRLGGARPEARRPPRPRLPWQYGSVVR